MRKPEVVLQVGVLGEALRTDGARKRLFPGVDKFVTVQLRRGGELLAAVDALVAPVVDGARGDHGEARFGALH